MTLREVFRVIRRLIALSLVNSATYRADMAMYMLGAMLSPIISLLVWRAAIASGASLPISETYITSYFVMLAIISVITSAWLSGFLAERIRTGELSPWLARPGSFIYELVANNVSEKVIKLVALVPMVIVFGFIYRDHVDLAAPGWRWAIVAISALLGAVIRFSLDVMEGSLGFWIEEIGGIMVVRQVLMLILAGQLVPLALMPEWSQGFLELQPFRYMLSFQIEIIVADLTPREVLLGLAMQIAWVVAFVLAARWLWGRGKRAYTAIGA